MKIQRRGEAGQATLEHVGTYAIAAVVVIAVIVALATTNLGGIVASALCKVAETAGTSISACAGAGGEDGPGEDGPGGPGDIPADQVDIPDGLDADSEIVQAMLSTPRGRATLQWMADNNIPVVVDPGATGAYWDGTQIVLGGDSDDAAVLVHEANHARYSVEGRNVAPEGADKQDYVDAAIGEEVDGTVQQILAAREFGNAGHPVGGQAGQAQFWAAYDSTIAAGGSIAAAEQAGYDAVLAEFTSGRIVTSTTGESYVDYYGDYWEDVN